MEQFSEYITELFLTLAPSARVLLVFLFSYIEGVPVIGSVFPGGTIALLFGSLSDKGFIAPLTAVVIIAFGSFFGDLTGFLIGKKLRHKRWVHRIVAEEKHQQKWDIFDRHLAVILIFGKLVPVVRSTPSIFAGARNIRVQKYLFFSFFGSFLWAFFGVYGGNLISKLAGESAILVILGILVVSGIVTFFVNFLKKKKKKAFK